MNQNETPNGNIDMAGQSDPVEPKEAEAIPLGPETQAIIIQSIN